MGKYFIPKELMCIGNSNINFQMKNIVIEINNTVGHMEVQMLMNREWINRNIIHEETINNSAQIQRHGNCNGYKKEYWPGMVAHPVILALWEAEVEKLPELRSSRPTWPTWGNPVSTKIKKKISWLWWYTPVVPATWRLRQENGLSPGGRGCSELRSYDWLHFSLSDRVRLHLKKRKKE